MTFEYSKSVASTASPAAVWSLWRDTTTWADWDPAVEGVQIEERFASGATGTMTLSGGIEVPITLEVVEEGRRYLDRLDLGELVIRIDHVVEPVGDGSRGCEITVGTVITGPGADDIGPMVTNDAPIALARLVERAEG